MRFLSVSPTIPVTDLERSIEFYLSIGGEKRWAWPFEGKPMYAGVDLGEARLMLHARDTAPEPVSVYIRVEGVNACFEAVERAGVKVEGPPTDYEYGMRDFTALDPDGNRVSFGEEIA